MVATQFARGRAVTAATLAMLMFAIVPVTPAQAQAAGDVYLEQGGARWYQSNFFGGGRATAFIDNGTTTSTLKVDVWNEGGELTNVPVYYWFDEASDRTDCKIVTLPAGTPAAPRLFTVEFDPVPTRVLAPGAYNVSIAVFPLVQPAAIEDDEKCPGTPNAPAPNCPNVLSCRVDPDTGNNQIETYIVKDFYLDLKPVAIRWCEGTPDPAATLCDDDMLNSDGSVYNVTPILDENDVNYRPNNTFFEVVIENVADKEWSWANLSNYGGECELLSGATDHDCVGAGFEYELNVSVTGPYISGVMYLTEFVQTTDHHDQSTLTHGAWTSVFELDGKAGPYNVSVKVDPRKDLRRHPSDTAADNFWKEPPVEVAYRDFTGNFTLPIGPIEERHGLFSGYSAATAYDYESFFEISGNITFANKGTAGRPTTWPVTGTTVHVNYTVYLDNLSWVGANEVEHPNTNFNRRVSFTPTDPNSTLIYELTWTASNVLTADNYLPPGRHTIHVLADVNEQLLELNETNNHFSFDIFIKDTVRPRFEGAPTITLARPGAVPQQIYRPHESFNVHADVIDDDNQVNVTVNFSLDSNQSVYRVLTATKDVTDLAPNRYVLTTHDFNFHNFSAVCLNCTENWTAHVFANDSFGNNVTSAGLPFKLKPWAIHNASADYVIEVPTVYPDATHPWNGPTNPSWVIRVGPNMTGFTSTTPGQHQQFRTSNLAYNITVEATGATHNLNGTYWSPRTTAQPSTNSSAPPAPVTECSPASRGSGGTTNQIIDGNVPGGSPTLCDEATNNTFYAEFPRIEAGAAGIWNYSIRVTDIAGHTRIINGTIDLEDFKPTINAWNLSGATEITPPGTVTVQANITDDNNQVAGAYLNLTRTSPGDGQVVNISLTSRDEPSDLGVTRFLYNQTIDIKRGAPNAIGLGGIFNATLHVVDDVGNWNSTGLPGSFTIKDEDAPQIVASGVMPSVVEIGENVTFWAQATDVTNVTMKLEIFRAPGSSELLIDPILIPQPTGSGPWNYTHTLNFTTEAVHGFRMTAIDSSNKASTPNTGAITIRDNLGPKYDIVSPSIVIDGDRYGSATPRIEVVVRDVEGVIGSSIEMSVAGLPADFELLPAPGNLNGYLVSYAVPPAKKFNHRNVIDVNLSAMDNSTETLASYYNFSFVVDDVAPTVRLVGISPSYRDQPAHVLNVSLSSRFTLAAEDIDNIPTGIPTGGIRYRILGGGPSAAETVYSGPFKINDASGVYTGPRLYQIQFWAEDDVGNFNRNFNVTTVYVDDTPPALFQFFPQGRSINATFVDDRVGVNRSVVWYRINDQAYTPLQLSEVEGAWTISLPEGVKGDRISYYLQAWDRLENTETFGNAPNPYASFDVSNHEPKIRIVTPVDGGRVSRTVELRWESSDEDGDALVYTIYYRAPGKTNFVELAKIENTQTQRYNIDTTRFADGQYTFRVAAGDGGFVKLAETTVTLINSATPIGTVSVTGDAVPGGTMLVTAEVTKAEATVEARLYQGTTLVDSFAMNDEGRDGDVLANDKIFSVRVPISSAGDYRFEIVTQYREDGVLKESSASPSSATFSAKLTPGYILSEYGAIIALIGLLAAVGIGVAVFVVMRRR